MLAARSKILICWTCRSDDTGLQVFSRARGAFSGKVESGFPSENATTQKCSVALRDSGLRLGSDLT
jgi:hypothetical protein